MMTNKNHISAIGPIKPPNKTTMRAGSIYKNSLLHDKSASEWTVDSNEETKFNVQSVVINFEDDKKYKKASFLSMDRSSIDLL